MVHPLFFREVIERRTGFKNLCIAFFAATVIISITTSLLIAADAENLDHYTLEDLMNIQVITAARTYTRAAESPAAVYVITEKQIRERGYRTLVEALYDVPGFDFQHTYGIWPDLFHQRGLVGNNQRSLRRGGPGLPVRGKVDLFLHRILLSHSQSDHGGVHR